MFCSDTAEIKILKMLLDIFFCSLYNTWAHKGALKNYVDALQFSKSSQKLENFAFRKSI